MGELFFAAGIAGTAWTIASGQPWWAVALNVALDALLLAQIVRRKS